MKILILGGNRFVGKMVAQKLSTSYDVTVLNRSGTGPDKCNIIQYDRNYILNIKNDYDLIIDFCLFNSNQAISLNKFLLHDQPYIFISSAAAYKNSNNWCYREDMDIGGLCEFGEYGIEKARCEKIINRRTSNNLILRPTYIIGDGSHRPRLRYYIQKLLKNEPIHVAGDGNKLLTFIWSFDIVNVLLDMVFNFKYYNSNGSVYNVANDDIYSSKSLIREIANILDIDPIIQENGSDSPFFDENLILSPCKLGRKFIPIKDRLPKFIDDCKSMI